MSTRASRTLVCAVMTLALSSASLTRAGDLLVSSRFISKVLRFDSQTGRFVGVFASGHGLANPNGIAYGPDGNLYVGNGDEGRVLRFDGQTGDYLGDFITPSTPGSLTGCRAIAFGPDGNLYVDSGATSNVLAYNGRTGAFLRVAAAGHGLSGPVGLTFGPDGNLYIGAALSNKVFVFDVFANFIRSFNCGNGFSNATGVLFDQTGRLLVAQSVSNKVLAFDPSNGACLGVVASGGGLSIPIGMILAPDGSLLVGSFGTDSAIKYDLATSQPLGTFIASGSGGLDGTHNFAFVPDLSCEQLRTPASGWWPADGTAGDLLSGNNGTLVNGAGFAPGKDGQSFLLDGANDFVNVPDQPALNPSSSFSLEAWIKTASPTILDETILAKNECGHACTPCVTSSYYGLSLASGHVDFRVRDNSPGCRSPELLEGRTSVGDGQWHHVVATRDVGAGALSLYVDGGLDARIALSPGADGALADDEGDPDPMTIGADVMDGSSSPRSPFAGQLDELVYYPRALSPCEIAAMVKVGHGIKCKGDNDADGIADYVDNCPTYPNGAQANGDGDTRGDSCDCSPAAAGSLAAPGEIGGLTLGGLGNKNRLEWCSMSAGYGVQSTYSVVRGRLNQLPVGTGPQEVCLGSGLTNALTTDSALPVTGEGLWYVVRGQNACAIGTYGFTRDGVERSTTTCP